MSKWIDLTGQRFGRLTVLQSSGSNRHGGALWRCHCDCGSSKVTRGSDLRRARTQSCGCWKRDFSVTHGMCYTPVFSSWRHMIERCTNPNHIAFRRYGARGITVCDRWLSFENFYADMGDRLEGAHLHRLDNNKGYEPDNCVWIDRCEHARLHNEARWLESHRNGSNRI